MKILCFSEAALITHKTFFTNFISTYLILLFSELYFHDIGDYKCAFFFSFSFSVAVLHFQLQEIPEDFFVDIVSRNNFLTATLQVYRYTRTHTHTG